MAPRTFKKVVVAVSGTFPGFKQADLKDLVEGQGATFSTSVSTDCTHLVTTQTDVEKKSAKYKSASNLSTCDIVNLDWLLDSVGEKRPLPAKSYLLDAAEDGEDDGDDGSNKQNGDDDKPKNEKNGKAKKRTLDDTLDDTAAESNKKQKDGQKTSSKRLSIPVDEGFHGFGYAVYIDSSGLIWDATLNQTNAGANNNKFYRIQLLKGPTGSYLTWTRWGRVGEHGQSASVGNSTLDAAQYEFQKKFKDKTGLKWEDRLADPKPKKYTFIERNYEESDDEDEDDTKKGNKKADDDEEEDEEDEEDQAPVESTLPEAVQNLMAFIFNQQHFLSTMADMSYDAEKMPLGKLSRRTLFEGFKILKDLSDLLSDPALAASKHEMSLTAAIEHLSNRYFTTIPHAFGRNRPPILQDNKLIKKEADLLETLTDMRITNEIMKKPKDTEQIHMLDRQYNGLGMQEMTPVDPKSSEFKELENYLHKSKGSTHHLNYKVINIFRIDRQGENDRFEKSYGKLQNSNRRLLWHGSRSTNYGGILSQGLRIAPPEAPVSGYMFGKGVYFADMSSKSANYCCPYSSAGRGLLLLCDVELGTPMYEQTDSNYNAASDSKKEGKLATLGRGATVPAGWKDAGCVHEDLEGVQMPDVSKEPVMNTGCGLLYNEYIVYDVSQIRQKYLIHVKM